MTSAPIINAISAATTAVAPKAGNGSAPEQSFGQVLAQQVNANAGTNAPAPAPTPAPAPAQASNNAPTPAPAASTPTPAPSGANGNTGSSGTTSGTTSGTNGTSSAGSAHGKSGKTKSTQGKDNADNSAANGSAQQNNAATDAAANGSAQLLALVSNVQQAASGASSTAGDAISALSGGAGSAQAALANFQAAIAGAGKNSSTDATTAITEDEETAQSDLSTKDLAPNEFAKQLSDITDNGSTTNQQTTQDLNIDSKNLAQPTLDLAASAEKDIQAGLASLDAAAAKSVDAMQSAAAAGAAAMPVAVNMQQTNVAAQAAASDTLAPEVGSTGWDQSLGQKVVWMVAGGQQSASLTLNPPDLGPLQVVLNVNNSHATATFTAAQPEVRQALENAMPKLREMLGDAGIQLGQTSVNAGNAQQQQHFAGQSGQKSSNGRGQSTDTIGAIDTSTATRTAQVSSAGLGLVDTFA